MLNSNSNVMDQMKNFHDQKQVLMVQLSLVQKKESDYFQNLLQENNSNTADMAEIENLKRITTSMREEMNVLKRENASLKAENENLKKDKKNDSKKMKRLENEVKSLTSKAKAVDLRHSKEVKKLNTKLSGKDKSIKYLREKYEVNKVSDMMSQKMTTRSIQHRVQIQQKFPPNNLHSKPEPSVKLDASIKSEPDEDKNEMKDDEEDEILASPQASQASQAPLFGDDLAQILNSDTQQSAVFGGPSRSAAVDTWSDEE